MVEAAAGGGGPCGEEGFGLEKAKRGEKTSRG